MADNDDFYNELLVEVTELLVEFGKAYKLNITTSYDYKQLSSSGSNTVDCMAVRTSWVSDSENGTWANKEVYIISASVEVLEGMSLMDESLNVIAQLTKVDSVKPSDVALIYIAEFET